MEEIERLGCTLLEAQGLGRPLEQEFGINVTTAGQAITWYALRRVGIDDKIEGHGRLMREF